MDANDGARRSTSTATAASAPASCTYWDLDADGYVSDDERDEDGDGLTNYDERHGRMTAGLLDGRATRTRAARTRSRTPAPNAFDADTDGDGILDGADDQDFDDVPNVMELSRNMAGNRRDPGKLRRTVA